MNLISVSHVARIAGAKHYHPATIIIYNISEQNSKNLVLLQVYVTLKIFSIRVEVNLEEDLKIFFMF
jgi:hypothetical protein